MSRRVLWTDGMSVYEDTRTAEEMALVAEEQERFHRASMALRTATSPAISAYSAAVVKSNQACDAWVRSGGLYTGGKYEERVAAFNAAQKLAGGWHQDRQAAWDAAYGA